MPDAVDRIYEDANRAELGPELHDRPVISPALYAGQQLTVALDVAERDWGAEAVCELLIAVLDDLPYSTSSPSLITLRDAIAKFRRCATVPQFYDRLRNRLNRLRGRKA